MAKKKTDIVEMMKKGMGESVKEVSPVRNWYDVGNYAINYIMSKNLKAGIPASRIVCFDGLSGTGKSLFACNVAKNKDLDLIIIIDTEGGGIGYELLDYVGADLSKVVLLKANTFESWRIKKSTQKIERVAEKDVPAKLETKDYVYYEGATLIVKKIMDNITFNKELREKKILIILDSIANLQSVRELNGTADMGTRAVELGRFFRTFDTRIESTNSLLIFTNKLYTNLGNEYVPYKAAGGENAIYNPSVTLRLSTTSVTDDKKEDEIKENRDSKRKALGANFKTMVASVIKSRFGTEGKSSQFLMETTVGLVRHSGLFKLLKDYGIIKSTGGSWYSCEPLFGEKKFQKKDFVNKLLEGDKEPEKIEILQKALDKREEEIKLEKNKAVEHISDDESELENLEDKEPKTTKDILEDLDAELKDNLRNDIAEDTE